VLLTDMDGTQAPYMAAAFTADPRWFTSHATYWLQIGGCEGPDAYAAVPGADYEILMHDGTWADIYGQLCAAWEIAREAAGAGLPSALIVNGMDAEWSMLCDLGDRRARRREAATLAWRGLDPDAAYASEVEVLIDHGQWTLIKRRHAQFLAKISTWPGPVVLIASDKVTADGRKVLVAQEKLPQSCSAWIRLSRDEEPEIVKLGTYGDYVLTTEERAALRGRFSLPWLIWEWSGCTTRTRAPEILALDADQAMPGEQAPIRPVASPPAAPRPVVARRDPVALVVADAPELTAEMARVVAGITDEWLALSDRGAVDSLWDRMTRDVGEIHKTVDVSGILRDVLRPQELVELGREDSVAYTLREFATDAAKLIRKTGQALRPVLVES
jgi:hypothetical protein